MYLVSSFVDLCLSFIELSGCGIDPETHERTVDVKSGARLPESVHHTVENVGNANDVFVVAGRQFDSIWQLFSINGFSNSSHVEKRCAQTARMDANDKQRQQYDDQDQGHCRQQVSQHGEQKVAQKYALLNVPIDITRASEVIAQRPCLVGVIANIRTKRIDRAQDRH